jgi:hypothetical protein
MLFRRLMCLLERLNWALKCAAHTYNFLRYILGVFQMDVRYPYCVVPRRRTTLLTLYVMNWGLRIEEIVHIIISHRDVQPSWANLYLASEHGPDLSCIL